MTWSQFLTLMPAVLMLAGIIFLLWKTDWSEPTLPPPEDNP